MCGLGNVIQGSSVEVIQEEFLKSANHRGEYAGRRHELNRCGSDRTRWADVCDGGFFESKMTVPEGAPQWYYFQRIP